jgi:hypothetical protein
MKKDDGGYFNANDWNEYEGISRRDWLAGLAMQGVCVGYFKAVLEDDPNCDIDEYQRMIAQRRHTSHCRCND